MKKISKSAVRFFTIAFIFFVVTITLFVLNLSYLSNMGEEHVDSLQLIANVDQQTREMSHVENIIEASADDRNRLQGYFLDVVQIAQFLETIEQYAASNNLTVGSVSISEIPTDGDSSGPARVRIPYEVSGSREAVLQFIMLLETVPYHSELERLRIRESAGSSLVSAEVDVIISYK